MKVLMRYTASSYFRKDWLLIIKRAWSFRLMAVAAVLSGCEVALPILHAAGYLRWMPQLAFALTSFAVVAAALVARVMAQKNMGD